LPITRPWSIYEPVPSKRPPGNRYGGRGPTALPPPNRGYALIHLPGLEDLLPLIPLPERREEPFAHGAELLRGHTDDPAVMWYAREFFALRDNDALGVEPFRAGPPLSHPPGYAPVTSA
jgi:hypothetical protein